MDEELTQPGLQPSVEMFEISGSTPVLGGESRSERRTPSRGESPLRLHALYDSKQWRTCARGQSRSQLKRKWRQASRLIQKTLLGLQQSAVPGKASSPDAEWLIGNARLLRSAVQEVRDCLKVADDYPEIEASHGRTIKRVYAAAAAYLRRTDYVFREETFVTYFGTVQEIQPLDIQELWALMPMMQLVLLEEIANTAEGIETKPAGEEKGQAHDLDSSLPSLINSLRDMGGSEWKEVFEKLSAPDRILRDDPSGTYPKEDFESRDLYRRAIQELAAYSDCSEVEVAEKAVALARATQSEWSSDARVRERRRHVGYYLIDKGRELLERQIRYRPRLSKRIEKFILAWPEVYYLVGIELLTFAIIAFVLNGVRAPVPLIFGLLLLLLPAAEAAVGVMNQLTTFILTPRVLAKLDFSEGIPADCTTLAVVPTLLISEEYIGRMVRDLEIRYLANRDPNLHFGLLTDSPDSTRPFDDTDELVGLCARLIEELNRKYAGDHKGSFFLLHRHRIYNPSEGTWMGWERKRGKLLDLNSLLRGKQDNFPIKVGDLSILPRVRYVLTLDSDTQLPRGTAHRLVGTLAHPLNRAVVDHATNMVVEGYGILQPRIGISIQSASRSLLASIYSGQTGFDPYTRATSDVYQDLFGEGSFTGKGIYEVDVFQQVLAHRFPNNAILSHDLIEGSYARAALVSDIELIDDYPSHFRAYSCRKHRWVRGDWQIMLWLLPRVPDFTGKTIPNPLSVIARWKILDNLRRSLIEIATFVLLLAACISLPGGPSRWIVATLVLMLIPTYLQFLLTLLHLGRVQRVMGFLKETAGAFVTGQVNVFFTLSFLSHQTLVMLDAIGRTIVRLAITRKRLLEWETAAEAELGVKKTPIDVYIGWTPTLSIVIGIALAVFHPRALTVASPLLALWACSKPLSRWLNRPMRAAKAQISSADVEFLRSSALRTWRYFVHFAREEGNGLIPDNSQESPPAVAHRISPTNLGLLLNARLAAEELGYLTTPEFASETEKTLATAKRLARYKGHFFNWYDTQTLEPIEPLFISTVDSGNLACCLWTLKQACRKMSKQTLFPAALWRGICDHVFLLDEAAGAMRASDAVVRGISRLRARIELLGENSAVWLRALPGLEQAMLQIERDLAIGSEGAQELRWWAAETVERFRGIRKLIEQLVPWLSPERRDLVRRIEAGPEQNPGYLSLDSLPAAVADFDRRLQDFSEKADLDAAIREAARSLRELLPAAMTGAEALVAKLAALAQDADRLAQEMDFRFLYNERRKVLSVGYDVSKRSLDTGCYDLLASEARAAVFVAVAKGDVPPESWFHLGRAHVLWNRYRALLSWSGTMFEYLMPRLWMKNYPNTLLERSVRAAVRCQQKWAKSYGTPWGISEAAYSARDSAGHYQYQAFGVPVLALKRTSYEDLVVAPYATFLALAVDPFEAVQNLRRMKEMKWLGAFGFYESADFAPSRLRSQKRYELVRCWMVHHQGMSLLAVCNLLCDDVIPRLFHTEPAVAATELLLQEKLSFAIRIEPAEEAPAAPRADDRGIQPAASPEAECNLPPSALAVPYPTAKFLYQEEDQQLGVN
jgi:cyclic beta-1,2-glucan synthetase